MIWIAIVLVVIAALLFAEGLRMIVRDDPLSREYKDRP